MVLDALLKIKNEQDPTLTFRRCVSIMFVVVAHRYAEWNLTIAVCLVPTARAARAFAARAR